MVQPELQTVIDKLKSAGLEFTREEYFNKLESEKFIPITISASEYWDVVEPVFEAMGIDAGGTHEKLDVYLLNKSQFNYFEMGEFSGMSYKAGHGTEGNRDEMFVDISCRPQQVLTTFGHEAGHIFKEMGFSDDHNEIIAEAIAIKSEREFIKAFNKLYNTDVKIEETFTGHQDKYEEGEKLSFTSIAESPIRSEYSMVSSYGD